MKTKARRQAPRPDAAAWSLIAILFIAPLAALASGYYLLATEQSKIVPPAEPVFASVERSDFKDSQAVKVGMTWSNGVALKSPEWSGLVTQVGVKPGDIVEAGTRIVRLDGTWRVAAPTPSPFYAPVGRDSPVEDVQALNALLRTMGYQAPGDVWSSRTQLSIRKFATDIGVPQANTVVAMDPSWLIWMPSPTLQVASVPLVLGVSAPSAGDDVLTGPPLLSSVTVKAEEGAALPSTEGDTKWIVRVGKASMPFSGPELSDASAASEVAASLASTKPEQVDGHVERADPVSGWQVPTTAVHTDVAGRVCIFRRDTSKTGYGAVKVDVQRGSIGTARVSGGLRRDDKILINPSDVARDASCNW